MRLPRTMADVPARKAFLKEALGGEFLVSATLMGSFWVAPKDFGSQEGLRKRFGDGRKEWSKDP